MSKIAAGLVIALGVLAAWWWGVHDIDAPSAPTFASGAMPPEQSNAFPALRLLSEEVAAVVSSAGIGGRQALEKISLEGTADEGLRQKIAALNLRGRLSTVTGAAALRAPDGSALGLPSAVSRQLLDMMRVLLTSVQNDLTERDTTGAWASAGQGLALCKLLQRQSLTLGDLVVARGCQEIAVRGLLAGVDRGQWPVENLRQLAELQALDSSQEVTRALQTDFAALFKEAPQSPETQGLLGNFMYHPNRSQKLWIEAMQAAFGALRARNLPEAYRSVARARGELRQRGGLRNAVGARLVTTRMASYEAPLAQSVNSQVQWNMLRLRCALELHRLEHGSWPSSLDSLTSQREAARDPWSGNAQDFQYRMDPRRIYSVGPNQRDDGGRIESNLETQNRTDDYGFRLP